MIQPPAFIAFTGVDRSDLLPGLFALSARYPIEWGVLVDPAQEDKPLFPDAAVRAAVMGGPKLRWAAHVCGEAARMIVSDPDRATPDITGFQRVQVNHGFSGSTPEQAACAARFGRRLGVRAMLQTKTQFPDDPRLDWLFDVSFGTGVTPASWPALPREGPFCGYSGGIGPSTVEATLQAIAAPAGALYWIDMESQVRTDGWLDLAKCETVCRAVYGA
jgi:hypothetical protein